MGKEYDLTREALKQVVDLAYLNKFYDTNEMNACICPAWQEKTNDLFETRKSMLSDMNTEERKEEHAKFKKVSAMILQSLRNKKVAITKSEEDFAEMERLLRGVQS